MRSAIGVLAAIVVVAPASAARGEVALDVGGRDFGFSRKGPLMGALQGAADGG